MKTIIVTRAIHELTESEQNKIHSLLNSTKIIKVCVNYAQYVGDIRIFHDYFCYPTYEKYPEPIIMTSNRISRSNLVDKKDIESGRVITYDNIKIPFSRKEGKLFFRSGTLTTAIDLCYSWLGSTECLLLATNVIDVKNKNFNKILFERQMKENVKVYPNLYSFKEDNNFDLKYKSLKEFING